MLAVHRVWPAVTISNYVIMPDHIHFLLIANYDRDRAIAPLFIAHRLADAIEMAQEEAERTGASAPEPPPCASAAPRPLADAMAQEEAEWTGASAPEPLASASAALEPLASAPEPLARAHEPLADMMARRISLAVEATVGKPLQTESKLRFGERKGGESGGAGARVPVRSVVFARDCYIELSFDSRQLKAIRHYIKLNPARALWKSSHPDSFICHRAIKSRRLARFAPRLFDGIGALPLLGSPFLFHVRLTLKKSVAEHEEAIAGIVEKARRGMIPVSGFISPGEVEALRRLKAEPRARFIKLLPCELPPRYDPSAEDSREIAAGRLLILSCFRGTPAITSLDMKRNPAAAHAFRRNCLAMNDLAAQLCDNAVL